MSSSPAMAHVARVARAFHVSSYLCALYLPDGLSRSAAMIFAALAGECSAACRQAKNASLASMRMAYWRQQVEQVIRVSGSAQERGYAVEEGGRSGVNTRDSGDLGSAPVIAALSALSEKTQLWESALNRRRVMSIIENAARCCGRGELIGNDAENESNMMGSRGGSWFVYKMEDMEAMAEGVDSNILYMTHEAARGHKVHDEGLSGSNVAEFEHAASHIGKATGIVRMIQNTPLLASERKTVLPAEVCRKYGLVMVCLMISLQPPTTKISAIFPCFKFFKKS